MCPCPAPPHIPTTGRAFSHLMGGQAWHYHQTRQEAAAEQDTHPVSARSRQHSPSVLWWLSARASCCTNHLGSHLLQSHGAGQALPFVPKTRLSGEASAMWGLALAFLTAPLHLLRTGTESKRTPWLRSSEAARPLCPDLSERWGRNICVQPGRRMSPK